jgi:hypothetical protein
MVVTSMVNDMTGSGLKGLQIAFTRIQLLLVRITLDVLNAIGAQDIKYLVANIDLSTVTDKFVERPKLNHAIL